MKKKKNNPAIIKIGIRFLLFLIVGSDMAYELISVEIYK